MDQERFGGSLVAPYRTDEPQPHEVTPSVPAPEDGRFGGSLVAPYRATEPPVEATGAAPALEVVPVEEAEEETRIVDYTSPKVLSGIGTDIESLPDDVDFDSLEALHHVEDEHIPVDSKPFHGKQKKRR